MSCTSDQRDKIILVACVAFLAAGAWLAVINISFFGDFGLGLFLGAFVFGGTLAWDLLAHSNYRYSATVARWNIGISFLLIFPYLIGLAMGAAVKAVYPWFVGGLLFNCFVSPAFSCLIIVLRRSGK